MTQQGTGKSGQRKDDDAKRGYDYLLDLSMRILTHDKVPPTPSEISGDDVADLRTRLPRSKN
jgi:hypothetical protein